MRRLQLAGLGLAALVLAGCSTFFTGGGWIRGVEGGKATFGFSVKCNGPDPEICAPARVNGTYGDQSVGVKLKFDGGIIAGPEFCAINPQACDNLPVDLNQCMGGEVFYTSQDKKQPGSGSLLLIACDLGEPGRLSGDFLAIDVESGPYDGYSNEGTIQGGNLQAH